MTWEQVLLQLIVSLAQVIPSAIEAIRNSGNLSEEQKKAALDILQAELEVIKARVTGVTFLPLKGAPGELPPEPLTPTNPGTPNPTAPTE